MTTTRVTKANLHPETVNDVQLQGFTVFKYVDYRVAFTLVSVWVLVFAFDEYEEYHCHWMFNRFTVNNLLCICD